MQNEQYSIHTDPSRWKVIWQDCYQRSLLLFVTGKCNLNCANCFSISSRNSIEMSLEQITQILDANPAYTKVDLMGGEPLLYSDIPALLALLREKKKQISVYTNGLLLPKLYDQGPLRACVSFHELTSSDPHRKPLMAVAEILEKFSAFPGNQLKLVFLMDRTNVSHAMETIHFVDQNLGFVNKLTIGLMRYENDYWNDDCPGVLPFAQYASAVQEMVDQYTGRLNLDIFLKGVLKFPGDPGNLPNRVNRFRCVFQDMSYSDCLYNACAPIHPQLDRSFKLPENRAKCRHTGRQCCLADKVRLLRV